MILVDMECNSCGYRFEKFIESDIVLIPCPKCNHWAKRIFTMNKVNIALDTSWIKTVREVVDKDSKEPHTVEFLKNPTRENYHKWMKKEGIRPLENGEKPKKREKVDERKILKEVLEKDAKRRRIEI
jgi:DNA-directed RNA polymerase subunit RPC12/RpoP